LKRLLTIAAACLIGLAPAVTLAAAPVPVADFFDNPSFGGPVLSPDGRLLAVRVAGKGARERLAVLDVTNNQAKVVASFADIDIGEFRWINKERLVFDTVDRHTAPGDVNRGPGLYAVNRDGSQFVQLASRTNNVSNQGFRPLMPWQTRLVPQAGKQDSEFVYVTLPQFIKFPDVDYVDLLRINTITGQRTTVQRPGSTRNWMLDHDGEPRLVMSTVKDRSTLSYREPASGAWRAIAEFGTYGGDGYMPLGFGPDGTLYARANKGGDKAAVHTVDLATGKLSEKAVLALDGYDFAGGLVMGRKGLLGVHYTTDAPGSHWLDPQMDALQKAVDALLPDTVNLISQPARSETALVLVASFSDQKPRAYRLYDRDKGTLNDIGSSHPNILPSQMGRQAMVRYKARDGLEIPAYLTLPAGAARKNLPLVVLVHGGPFVRGASWGWKADTQFLASRGYAVLEPAFRGSTGYGSRHHKAGWKQWGLAMQNDVADGATWAIAEGIADPKRICIAGASYGGYATLMGLINDPAIFKCGISWAGVSDLALLHSGHWSFESDMTDNYRQHGFPVLVGDPVADAEQFKATSPLQQAARLKQPLLLAHGSADKRVPIYHSTRFRDAVKAGNSQLEWVEYPEEGHGWTLPKNRIDFWTRVETFLEQHIGKP